MLRLINNTGIATGVAGDTHTGEVYTKTDRFKSLKFLSSSDASVSKEG